MGTEDHDALHVGDEPLEQRTVEVIGCGIDRPHAERELHPQDHAIAMSNHREVA